MLIQNHCTLSLKSLLAKPFAAYEQAAIDRKKADPAAAQRQVFKDLMKGLSATEYGRAHSISVSTDVTEFRQKIALQDYEGLRAWIDKIREGAADVLWPGRPLYFAKTSGTTSGSKFIPLTKDSMPNHIGSARATLTSYIKETGNSGFVDGKMIFLQGSPVLDTAGSIPTGRLSGIVYHHVPGYLLRNRLPSWETNVIEDWEEKVEAVCRETMQAPMTLISGIPPWVIMYFERLLELSGKSTIRSLFPRFSVFVHGGVNFKPYAARINELVGESIDMLETYPASEGFIAYQDSMKEEGLLLNCWSGIWFEFVEAGRWDDPEAPRLSIEEVQIGVNYAIIINNNAGLWGYQIGDTVRFTSLDPCRIVVTGRTAHYISAFGEHVISEEVESAMRTSAEEMGLRIVEFTVAPKIGQEARHQWFVEFQDEITDRQSLATLGEKLNESLCAQNTYYKDLIEGGMLLTAEVLTVKQGGFKDYQRKAGKLGGQNKVARLANNRNIADALLDFVVSSSVKGLL